MRYATYGYLASDGVTVYSVYHTNDDGGVSWEHGADTETRDACKVCGASKVARDKVNAQRAASRMAQTAPSVSTAHKQKTGRQSSDASDAKRAMVDAMRESMAEESSEQSEAFRKRLADSLDRTVTDTDAH